MSKALIIKGADFSVNAVKTINPNPTFSWIIDERDYESGINASSINTYAPFTHINYESLQNKTISKIRVTPKSAGTLSILLAPALGAGIDAGEIVATLEFTSEMIDVPTEFDVSIPVGNKVLMVNAKTDTALFGFKQYGSSDLANFYMNSLVSNYSRGSSNQKLCISFGVWE